MTLRLHYDRIPYWACIFNNNDNIYLNYLHLIIKENNSQKYLFFFGDVTDDDSKPMKDGDLWSEIGGEIKIPFSHKVAE